VVGTGDHVGINLGNVVGARGFIGNDQTLAGDDYPAVFERNFILEVPYHFLWGWNSYIFVANSPLTDQFTFAILLLQGRSFIDQINWVLSCS
jgi:hypothetical protein